MDEARFPDEDGGGGGGADLHGQARPQTKAQMNELRAAHGNTLRLCAHLYQDRSLQQALRMVYVATKPVMQEYKQRLELQKTEDR